MQTIDGDNEKIPTSRGQLSPPPPLQIPAFQDPIHGQQNLMHGALSPSQPQPRRPPPSSPRPQISINRPQDPMHGALSPSSPPPQVSIHRPQNPMHGALISPTPPQRPRALPPPPQPQPKVPMHGPLSPSPSQSSSPFTMHGCHSVPPSGMIPIHGPPSPIQSPSSSRNPTRPLNYQPFMMQPPPFYSPNQCYFAPYPQDYHHSFYFPMIPENNYDHNEHNLKQPWSTGLCDCFSDLKNSFITLFLPCVTFGQIAEILTEGHIAWWESALLFGLLDTLSFSQVSSIYAWYYRVKFRKKYNLKGNSLSELVINLFCMRLVLCQNYRQLNHLGFHVALGWKATKEKQRRMAREAGFQFVPPMVNPGMFR